MAPQSSQSLKFGPYRLDRDQRLLFRGSEIIPLAPRLYDTLLALVESGGRVVDKEDLLRRVWQDAFVEEGSLARNVSTLRRILGESPRDQKYIVTVPKRGYRFAAILTTCRALDQQGAGADSIWSASAQTSTSEGNGATLFSTSHPASERRAQKIAQNFVGRDLERKWLEGHFENMLGGAGKLVFLTGEAGMGKSSLAEWFINSIRSRHPELRVATGRSVEQYGPGESYLPFLEALSGLLREHGNQIRNHLRRQAPTWCLQLPAFASGAERAALRSETAGATNQRMLREIGDALGALSLDAPLLLLLEDLHWADRPTIDLLRHLCHRVEAQRVLLLATVRPEDIQIPNHALKNCIADMKARQSCDEIVLDALTEDEVCILLCRRFEPNQFPNGFASLIWKRTDGNPLFTVSLLDFLASSDDIVHDGVSWNLASPPAQMVQKIPDSVRAMIRQKSEVLEPDARLALQYASIEGEEFLSSVVARLLDTEQLRVEEGFVSLALNQRLISVRGEEELPDGVLVTRYAFAHALYQNVFYEEIVGARRIQLHAIAGEQLLKHYGDLAPRIAGQLAMHFERGRNWERAVEFLMIAAANARNMYANSEAEEYYTHAIEVSARLPESARAEAQFRIYEKRAAVYLAMSRFDLSIADGREMIQRARAAGSAELECVALYTLGNTLFWAHRLDEMQSTLEDVLRVSAANEAGRLRALALMAQGHLASGDLSAAEDKLRTLVQCSLSLDRKTLLDSLDIRARLSFFRSEYDDAEQMFRQQIELAFELGDAFEYVKANYFLGLTLANLGRVSEAFAVLSSAMDIAKRNGEIFWLSRMPNAFGWIHREMQDFEGAEAFDREGAAIGHEAGFGEAEVNSVINLAMDHLQSDDQATVCSAMKTAASLLSHDAWFRWRFEIRFLHARAEQTLARTDAITLLEKATQYGAHKYMIVARTLLSRIAMLSDFDTAAEEIKEACAMLKRYPALLCGWRAHAMLGRIEMQCGNPDAGIAAYRLAVSNIRYIADHIDDKGLRNIFLSSDAILDVLRDAGEQISTE
ncbi:MAG TPA: AAA family ATPase [Bryobacteraceae bacterium]|jgi:DNA-binding winged helix-turn-helix (wHTH) protein/tetratricopeptide (TPR) repeat protein